MKSIIPFILILILIPSAQGIEFFSTANVENYRTDLGTTLVSPNLYFKFGRLEGYGFYDRYLEEPQFYHGEFQLIFTPVNKKFWDRFSLIAESRWDKFARDENSWGIRFKLW